MRHCPTLPGDDRPLIAHTIASGLCMERQRDFYHKCHRCIYRGRAADYVLEPGRENGKVAKSPARAPRSSPAQAVMTQGTSAQAAPDAS